MTWFIFEVNCFINRVSRYFFIYFSQIISFYFLTHICIYFIPFLFCFFFLLLSVRYIYSELESLELSSSRSHCQQVAFFVPGTADWIARNAVKVEWLSIYIYKPISIAIEERKLTCYWCYDISSLSFIYSTLLFFFLTVKIFVIDIFRYKILQQSDQMKHELFFGIILYTEEWLSTFVDYWNKKSAFDASINR